MSRTDAARWSPLGTLVEPLDSLAKSRAFRCAPNGVAAAVWAWSVNSSASEGEISSGRPRTAGAAAPFYEPEKKIFRMWLRERD